MNIFHAMHCKWGANLVSVAHGANVAEIQLVSELLRALALGGENGEDERGEEKYIWRNILEEIYSCGEF